VRTRNPFKEENKTLELEEDSFTGLLKAFGLGKTFSYNSEKQIKALCIYKDPIEPQAFGDESPKVMKYLNKHSLVIFKLAPNSQSKDT